MMTPAKIQVRFTDLDVLGHVNNNVYLSYFEMTRVHYFKELLGENWDWRKFGIVLVKNDLGWQFAAHRIDSKVYISLRN